LRDHALRYATSLEMVFWG